MRRILALIELVLVMVFQIASVIVTWLYVSRRWLPNYTQEVIDEVVPQLFEGFKKQFLDPTVKKGFSLAATLSGENRSVKAVQNKMATGVLDSRLGGLKLVAKQIGIDIDEMIEDHGAVAVLQAVDQFLPFVKGMLPSNLKSRGKDILP